MAFESNAVNFDSRDTGTQSSDIFVHDQFQQMGTDTRINIDRNGKQAGGITPLVIVNDMAIASLRQPNNFMF